MEISPFGDNLTIIISCENQLIDHWLSHASWYSIVKSLPHAKVKVLAKRTEDANLYFNWCSRRDINCYLYNDGIVQEVVDRNKYSKKPYLIIPASVMAIREFDENWLDVLNGKKSLIIGNNMEFWTDSEEKEVYGNNDLCCDVTDSSVTTFVQYGDFGNFVCREWINKRGSFARKIEPKTTNESKVIDLWNRSQSAINL